VRLVNQPRRFLPRRRGFFYALIVLARAGFISENSAIRGGGATRLNWPRSWNRYGRWLILAATGVSSAIRSDDS
jgi:hypothetical protein